MSFSVAVVGATGVVGEEFLRVLAERRFPVKRLRLMASPRSAGKKVAWQGQTHVIEDLAKADFQGVDLALFSAGSGPSKEHAPRVAKQGALVRAIVVMAHSLGLTVVAEGVETEPQRAFLEQHGCDIYQGHLLSAPLPAQEMARYLRQNAPSVSRIASHSRPRRRRSVQH